MTEQLRTQTTTIVNLVILVFRNKGIHFILVWIKNLDDIQRSYSTESGANQMCFMNWC